MKTIFASKSRQLIQALYMSHYGKFGLYSFIPGLSGRYNKKAFIYLKRQ